MSGVTENVIRKRTKKAITLKSTDEMKGNLALAFTKVKSEIFTGKLARYTPKQSRSMFFFLHDHNEKIVRILKIRGSRHYAFHLNLQ